MKAGTLLAKFGNGKTCYWRFGKDGAYWYLIDHTNYRRTLESTWNASVYRIRAIAENHGMTVNVS